VTMYRTFPFGSPEGRIETGQLIESDTQTQAFPFGSPEGRIETLSPGPLKRGGDPFPFGSPEGRIETCSAAPIKSGRKLSPSVRRRGGLKLVGSSIRYIVTLFPLRFAGGAD